MLMCAATRSPNKPPHPEHREDEEQSPSSRLFCRAFGWQGVLDYQDPCHDWGLTTLTLRQQERRQFRGGARIGGAEAAEAGAGLVEECNYFRMLPVGVGPGLGFEG